jgi:hypothetical protein
VAGSGAFGFRYIPLDGSGEFRSNGAYSGDGGPATSARLNLPTALAFDRQGNLYIVDSGNQRIRKVDSSGTITTFAGAGPTDYDRVMYRSVGGFSGDGGSALQALLHFASSGFYEVSSSYSGIAVDADGGVFFSDSHNRRVRKVGPDGVITTVAGDGATETAAPPQAPRGDYYGDGGPALEAALGAPAGLAIDADGNLYVADTDNQRIRKVNKVAAPGLLAGSPLAPPGPAGAPVPEPGDVDGDGEVTITDAVLGLRYLVELLVPASHQRRALDYNGDGTIDILDVIAQLRQVVGVGEGGEGGD